MSTKKIDPIQALSSSDCKTRNAAMVYLHEDRATPFEFLAEVTGLALSTVKNYVRSKFAHLLEWAREIFLKAKKIINRAEEQFYCYIDKIILPNGSIWCKIGQTTKTPEQRAKGFYWTIDGKKTRPAKVEVQWSTKCKDLPSMDMMENCLRTAMTMINPEKFCKNDRLLCWENDYPQRILQNDFVKMGLTQFAA